MLALVPLFFLGISRIIPPAGERRNRTIGIPVSGRLMLFLALHITYALVLLLLGAMVGVTADLLGILTSFPFSGISDLGFLSYGCCSCCNSVSFLVAFLLSFRLTTVVGMGDDLFSPQVSKKGPSICFKIPFIWACFILEGAAFSLSASDRICFLCIFQLSVPFYGLLGPPL